MRRMSFNEFGILLRGAGFSIDRWRKYGRKVGLGNVYLLAILREDLVEYIRTKYPIDPNKDKKQQFFEIWEKLRQEVSGHE